jgi:hypothetical protein
LNYALPNVYSSGVLRLILAEKARLCLLSVVKGHFNTFGDISLLPFFVYGFSRLDLLIAYWTLGKNRENLSFFSCSGFAIEPPFSLFLREIGVADLLFLRSRYTGISKSSGAALW